MSPTTPLPVQEPAGAVEAGKLAREALALLLDQRNRRVDQLSVGAGMAWAMAAEALTALASLPPVTQPDVSIPGPGMNASGERVDSANVMQANELAQAHEARRQAQANEERAKAALAGARIDLMRELREQGWSATTTQAKSEAVAWRDPSNHNPGQGCTYDSRIAERWPHIYSQPLYAAPQEAVERQPLTDSDLDAMWTKHCKANSVGGLTVVKPAAFARAVLAAHGIGPATQEKQHG